MDGGTTFHFVTDGIEAALAQARAAAGDGGRLDPRRRDHLNQYLAAGLVDELRLHIVPFTLGAGAPAVRRRPAAEARTGDVAGGELGHARDLSRAVLNRRRMRCPLSPH